MSSFSQAVFADGTKKMDGDKLADDAEHYIWESVTYDMFMASGVNETLMASGVNEPYGVRGREKSRLVSVVKRSRSVVKLVRSTLFCGKNGADKTENVVKIDA